MVLSTDNQTESDNPYICFNVKTETKGIMFPADTKNTIQLPDRFITTWKNESQENTSMIATAVQFRGSRTSKMIKSNTDFIWPPFILFRNETFKYEYRYCLPENRILISDELICKEWMTKSRVKNAKSAGTSILMKVIDHEEMINVKFSFRCQQMTKEEYDHRKEDNKFGEMSENDKLKLCQHYKSPGYCPKLTEAQLEEQTPREQPIEAVTSAIETPEAVTSATEITEAETSATETPEAETPKKGHCPNQSVKKR